MVDVIQPKKLMRIGLELAGYTRVRQRRACTATNMKRFKNAYGSIPKVYAKIWRDLAVETGGFPGSHPSRDPNSQIQSQLLLQEGWNALLAPHIG